MQSGKLRHRITLQARSGAVDDLGQPLDDWADVLTTWATVQPVSGREFQEGAQVEAEVTHKVWLRWRAGVALTPEMRVVYDGRVLDILSAVNVEERNRMWLLLCREAV